MSLASPLLTRLRQFNALTKPRVIQLIVFCALIGMVLAVPGVPSWPELEVGLLACLGIWFVSGAAAAFNCLVEKGIDLRELNAQQIMHPNPTTLRDTALAAEAAELMEQKRITSVLVVNDKNELCGVVNSNDLMRAKVI